MKKLLAPLLFAIGAGGVHAAPFKVYSPIVESGVTEIEYRAYRDFDDRDEIDHSQKHKIAVGHGFDRWSTELEVEFEKEGSESLATEAFEWENVIQFAPQGKYWADTGVLIEYEHAAHDGGPQEIKIAPLIEKEIGSKLVATVNLIFSHEFGRNAEPGNSFEYAARLRYTLNPLFDPAIEFYGDSGRLHHFPTVDEQSHWIGPAFYGKARVGHGHSLGYSAALLFGTTSAASDTRAVARVEYEF